MITVPPDIFRVFFFLIKRYNFSYFSMRDFRLSVHDYCLVHSKNLTLLLEKNGSFSAPTTTKLGQILWGQGLSVWFLKISAPDDPGKLKKLFVPVSISPSMSRACPILGASKIRISWVGVGNLLQTISTRPRPRLSPVNHCWSFGSFACQQ